MPKVKLEIINKIFGKGTVDKIDASLIERGAASASENFLTELDHIELTRGRKLMGAEETGNNPVLGLHTITKIDGTDIMFRKIGTKLQYYNAATELWVDAKTGLIDGEEISFANSYTPAGRQVWACGLDGLLKIYPSSPISVLDLTSASKNYKSKIRIQKSRMVLWGRSADPTGLYFSKVDKDANYTSITAEAVGALGSTHYTGTLDHAQLFGLVIKDGTQTLTDDKNGGFTGDGTGTINYATGAYDVTFNAITTGPVVADYLYEVPTTNGLADFTYSGTRVAGEGNIQRQDAIGSKSQNVLILEDKFYTLQDKGAFRVTIDPTDLVWTNELYNTEIGTPTWKASVEVADGIIFIDTFDPENPKLRKLAYDIYNDKVVPTDLSVNFKMENYYFDKSAMKKFGDYIVFSCRTKTSTVNNRTIIYNLKYKSFDVLLNGYNFFTIADNKLYGGDSASPNVYEILSGYDDLDYDIEGSWETKNDNLGSEQLKKCKQFIVGGYIKPTQGFKIYASYDGDNYQLIGSFSGDDENVQTGNFITIGSIIVGSSQVGGEGLDTAYYFKKGLK